MSAEMGLLKPMVNVIAVTAFLLSAIVVIADIVGIQKGMCFRVRK